MPPWEWGRGRPPFHTLPEPLRLLHALTLSRAVFINRSHNISLYSYTHKKQVKFPPLRRGKCSGRLCISFSWHMPPCSGLSNFREIRTNRPAETSPLAPNTRVKTHMTRPRICTYHDFSAWDRRHHFLHHHRPRHRPDRRTSPFSNLQPWWLQIWMNVTFQDIEEWDTRMDRRMHR